MAQAIFELQLARPGFSLKSSFSGGLDSVTAVFGPSGAGKSTLLRALAGLEPDASGRITFGGTTWLDSGTGLNVAPHLRRAGVVFQDTRLFAHLNVAGNLRFAARRARPAGPASFNDVVGAFDIGPLLQRRVGGLSGGERQRVAMARAVLGNPVLLMMDEPLSGLDIRRKAAILPYIADLPTRFGIPVLYVTHAIDEVTRIAGQLIAMQDGQITDHGPLAETFARLDLGGGGSRFEAGVILTAEVTGHDETFQLTHLSVGGQRLVMPSARVPVGAQVQLRVRARDVMIATRAPEGLSAQNILQARVRQIQTEDTTTFCEVFMDASGAVLRARVSRAAVSQLGLTEGQQVFAVIKAISFDRRVL